MGKVAHFFAQLLHILCSVFRYGILGSLGEPGRTMIRFGVSFAFACGEARAGEMECPIGILFFLWIIHMVCLYVCVRG